MLNHAVGAFKTFICCFALLMAVKFSLQLGLGRLK